MSPLTTEPSKPPPPQSQSRLIGTGATAIALLALLSWRLWPEGGDGAQREGGTADVAAKELTAPSFEVDSRAIEVPARPAHPMRNESAAAAASDSPRALLVAAAYGDDEDQLGLSEPPDGEGEVEGPSSFLRLPDGNLLVLDSQHQRLCWYDREGNFLRARPVPLAAPADVVLGEDGELLVLDRWRDRALLRLSADGELLSRQELSGLDTVDGIYTANGLVFAEEPGGISRAIASTQAQAPDTPPQVALNGAYTQDGRVPGYLLPDGSLTLSAHIDSRSDGQWSLSAIRGDPPQHRYSRQYDLDTSVLGVDILGVDEGGTAYLAYTSSQLPHVTVLCLDAENGVPMGAMDVPQPERAVSMARTLRVDPQGGIVYAQGMEDGLRFQHLACP